MNGAARALAAALLACAAGVAAAGWSFRLADGRQVAILPDSAAGDSAHILERRNPDGSLDQQFGVDGRVIFSLGADSPGPRSVRIDKNGRLLVVGAAMGAANREVPASLRFLSNGKIDLTWGIQGRSLLPSPVQQAHGADILQLPDESVLVLGQLEGPVSEQAALWRMTSRGVLDPSFGTAGMQRATGLEASEALGLQLDDDGAVLIAVQSVRQGLAWLEVHRLPPGVDLPQRVALQPRPANWRGPVTLARTSGTWQWFDASQASTKGGVALVGVAATTVWSHAEAKAAVAPPVAPAISTDGGAAWNPFAKPTEAEAPPAADGTGATLGSAWLGWLLLGIATLLGMGWWRWRRHQAEQVTRDAVAADGRPSRQRR